MSPSADISGVFARKRGIAHQQKSGDSTRCTVSTPGPGPAESVGKPRKSLLVVDVIAGDFSFFFFFSPFPSKACLFTLHLCRAAPRMSRRSLRPFPNSYRHLLEACIHLLPSPGESWIAEASKFFSFPRGSSSPFRAVANQTKRWQGAGGEKKREKKATCSLGGNRNRRSSFLRNTAAVRNARKEVNLFSVATDTGNQTHHG